MQAEVTECGKVTAAHKTKRETIEKERKEVRLQLVWCFVMLRTHIALVLIPCTLIVPCFPTLQARRSQKQVIEQSALQVAMLQSELDGARSQVVNQPNNSTTLVTVLALLSLLAMLILFALRIRQPGAFK
jgi:hypothetical protein